MLMQNFQVQITKIIMKSLIWTTLLSSGFISYSIFQCFLFFFQSVENWIKRILFITERCHLQCHTVSYDTMGVDHMTHLKSRLFVSPFFLFPKHSQRSRVHLLRCLDELIQASHPLPALFLTLPASLHHLLLLALNDKSNFHYSIVILTRLFYHITVKIM